MSACGRFRGLFSGARCILPWHGAGDALANGIVDAHHGAGGVLATHDAQNRDEAGATSVSGAGGALAKGMVDAHYGAGGILAAHDEHNHDGAGIASVSGAGGVLAKAASLMDEFRGGAGGAAATRRKRTEKLLAGLHNLLSSCGGEEDTTAESDPADDAELLFSQLEQLLWDRPADPFRHSKSCLTIGAPNTTARMKTSGSR